MTGTGRVVALRTYPVKGCAGTELAAADLTPAGLAHDRTFMVVDEHGTFRTQRGLPRLATIRPDVRAGGAELLLRAPGVEDLRLAVDLDAPRRPVDLFGSPLRGIDQGDEVAAWFSDVLGAASRLVRVPPEHDRATGGETPGTCAYADSGALLITSRASLEELNRRIGERGAPPVPMDRFRPNVVVDGWAEPHVEDQARDVRIGDAELGFAKLAVRCAVTLVDQRAGVRAGPEPLRTLAGYRRVTAAGVAFGAKFSVLRPGRPAVGDEVRVQRWTAGPVTA
ncbi:MAG TPA: MOSC N-terminal beta barrel domain-containing protein [Pseudonocardia sp.]|nr:MOSC N-terminal beta barrel domain-containing protein [Pseudonocardia sp.]